MYQFSVHLVSSKYFKFRASFRSHFRIRTIERLSLKAWFSLPRIAIIETWFVWRNWNTRVIEKFQRALLTDTLSELDLSVWSFLMLDLSWLYHLSINTFQHIEKFACSSLIFLLLVQLIFFSDEYTGSFVLQNTSFGLIWRNYIYFDDLNFICIILVQFDFFQGTQSFVADLLMRYLLLRLPFSLFFPLVFK